MLSAIVVSAARDGEVVDWVADMGEAVRNRHSRVIHYRNLSDPNREAVSRMLARKPVRIFIVASHKDTMRNHQNQKLGRANDKTFYNWCLRILLERVTEWCYRKCIADGIEVSPARFVFSERGGHNYKELRAYLAKLEAQTLTRTLKLDAKGLAPGIIVNSLCDVRPHADIAGLQLADVAASAFFQAACSTSKRHTLIPAMNLRPRVARQNSKPFAGFGLMLLPFRHQGTIPESDQPIFRHYGYDFRSN